MIDTKLRRKVDLRSTFLGQPEGGDDGEGDDKAGDQETIL